MSNDRSCDSASYGTGAPKFNPKSGTQNPASTPNECEQAQDTMIYTATLNDPNAFAGDVRIKRLIEHCGGDDSVLLAHMDKQRELYKREMQRREQLQDMKAIIDQIDHKCKIIDAIAPKVFTILDLILSIPYTLSRGKVSHSEMVTSLREIQTKMSEQLVEFKHNYTTLMSSRNGDSDLLPEKRILDVKQSIWNFSRSVDEIKNCIFEGEFVLLAILDASKYAELTGSMGELRSASGMLRFNVDSLLCEARKRHAP